MLAQFTGEIAALGTALMFAFGSALFAVSGREIGSSLLNRSRLVAAMIFVVGLHWYLVGNPLQMQAGANRWFWLGVSGIVGLALGDAALFKAFVLVGPRISMLIMSLAPVLGAVLGWLFLGETLTAIELCGIGVTMAGVAFVVSERQGKSKGGDTADDSGAYLLGLLFALGGATGQAGGLVLAKVGLANDFPAVSGLLIRITVALIAIWGFSLLRGELVSSVRTLRAHPRATLALTIAAFLGPTVGVWLSLIAVQRAPVGIASTLMSLTPVFLIPIGALVFKERITAQAITGTLVAFAGMALLFV